MGKIFDHITNAYPKYLNQVCGGTDIGACAVMYENRAIFITLASSPWGDTCVASLFMTALDMFWSEARLGSWFDSIRNEIKPEHLKTNERDSYYGETSSTGRQGLW